MTALELRDGLNRLIDDGKGSLTVCVPFHYRGDYGLDEISEIEVTRATSGAEVLSIS